MTSADKMYQLLWIKAFDEGEVRVPFENKRPAIRLRMALYNSVQKVKKFPLLNPALAEAVEHCLICLEDGGRTVVVQRKDTTIIGEAVLGALGITGEELRSTPVKRIAANPSQPLSPCAGHAAETEDDEARAMASLSQNSTLCGLIERE